MRRYNIESTSRAPYIATTDLAHFTNVACTISSKITSWVRDVNSRDETETTRWWHLEAVSRPRRRDRNHIPGTYGGIWSFSMCTSSVEVCIGVGIPMGIGFPLEWEMSLIELGNGNGNGDQAR